MTVTGETLRARLASAACVGRSRSDPAARRTVPSGGRTRCAVRLARAERRDPEALGRRPEAVRAQGRAVVFTSPEDLARRIDDPALDVGADDFLVMQNSGPKSGYGMPEAGYLPIPAKLAKAGVKDMVRISDARMSGTAYGTIVLHVSPRPRRRAARARAQRRSDSPECRCEAPRSRSGSCRARATQGSVAAAGGACARLSAAVRRSRDAGGAGLRL